MPMKPDQITSGARLRCDEWPYPWKQGVRKGDVLRLQAPALTADPLWYAQNERDGSEYAYYRTTLQRYFTFVGMGDAGGRTEPTGQPATGCATLRHRAATEIPRQETGGKNEESRQAGTRHKSKSAARAGRAERAARARKILGLE